ncbi:MAG: hypothetical protein HC897_11550 [Thermoanaerobaculia bacterium]|nr:hypothetical protein [Thermoanaerobaculia bacterium]
MEHLHRLILFFIFTFGSGLAANTALLAEEVETRRPPLPKGTMDFEGHQTLPSDAVLSSAEMPPIEIVPKYVSVEDGEVAVKAVLASENFEGNFPSAGWTVFHKAPRARSGAGRPGASRRATPAPGARRAASGRPHPASRCPTACGVGW